MKRKDVWREILTNKQAKAKHQVGRVPRLTYVFLNAKLKFLAFHLLDFLIVEFVPVSSVSVPHVGDVVARICADAPVDQHRAQLVHAALPWRSRQFRRRKLTGFTAVSSEEGQPLQIKKKTTHK